MFSIRFYPFPLPLPDLTLPIHHGSPLDLQVPPYHVHINPFRIGGKIGVALRKIGLSRLRSPPTPNVEILWKRYRAKNLPLLVMIRHPQPSRIKNNRKY